MVRHLRVRSKLLLLIAAPLIGLLVFAGLNVSTRLDAVDEARSVEGLAQVAQRVDTLLTALQRERRLSGQGEAGDEASASVAEARQAVDRAAADLRPSQVQIVDEAAHDRLQERFRNLQGELERLEGLRESVDSGQESRAATEREYSAVVSSVVEAQQAVGAVLPGSEAADDLAALAGLSALVEVVTREELLVERTLEAGEFSDRDYADYVAQLAVADRVESEMLSRMRTDHRAAYRRSGPGWTDPVRRVRQEAVRSSTVLDIAPGELTAASVAYEERLQELSGTVAGDIVTRATAAGAAARNDALRAGGLSVGVTALALLLSVLVTRQTVRPITRLTELSQEISQDRLPQLVETMRRGGAGAQDLDVEPIDIDSRDEIGRLAGAFDEIRAVAVRTATDLSELTRKGISDLFVNLARRNQSLLDRQITVLDRLEQDEDDPEALEQLFTLDHLATRMRRNAESLLVLAGAETPRRWSQPVPLEEVVRAAVGEVEAYARVQATGMSDRMVSGRAAADMAHLVAELLENATVYSPPSAPVSVTTRSSEDGLVVSITDRGLGMSAEALAEANRTLAEPPAAGFGLSRSLGFIVTGLLAKRHGVRVRLDPAEAGGTTAEVLVPSALLTDPGSNDLPLVDREEDEAEAEQPRAEDAPLQALLEEAAQPLAERRERRQPIDDLDVLDVPGLEGRQRQEGGADWTAPGTFAPEQPAPSAAAPETSTDPAPVPQPPQAPADGASDPAHETPEAPAEPAARSTAAEGGAGSAAAEPRDDAAPSPPAPPASGPATEQRAQPRGPAVGRTFREALPRRRAAQPRGKSSWSLPAPSVPRESPPSPDGERDSEGTEGPSGAREPTARASDGEAPDGQPPPLPTRRPRPSPAAEGNDNGDGNGASAPLPRRSPGASGRGSQGRQSGFLADEPAAPPAHKDTSDILARYLTGMNRTKQPQTPEGEAASSAPSTWHGPGREDQ